MGRPSKIALSFLLLLLSIAAVVWFQFDAIAQHWLEQTASRALGVNTEIRQLTLKPCQGQLHLQHLTIANPPGFRKNHFLEAAQVDMTVQPSSLLSPTLQIPQLQINDLVIQIEQNVIQNNLLKILRPLHGLNLSQSRSQASGQSVHLQAMNLNNITVNFDLELSPLGHLIPFLSPTKHWQFTLPSLDLKDLDSDSIQQLQEFWVENSEDLIQTLVSSVVFTSLQALTTEEARSLLQQLFQGQWLLESPSETPSRSDSPAS